MCAYLQTDENTNDGKNKKESYAGKQLLVDKPKNKKKQKKV